MVKKKSQISSKPSRTQSKIFRITIRLRWVAERLIYLHVILFLIHHTARGAIFEIVIGVINVSKSNYYILLLFVVVVHDDL